MTPDGFSNKIDDTKAENGESVYSNESVEVKGPAAIRMLNGDQEEPRLSGG